VTATTEAPRTLSGHGGELALAPLRAYGVDQVFTLSGGHIFPLLDACVKQGVRIVDVRHEQTAAFAAEALAKLTRRPGVALLTAGPGVTNGVSALTTARFNGAPLVVLGGRAPQARWGAGSLQELDHVPIVAPVTKRALTVAATEAIPAAVADAVATALAPHRGPVFVDFPLDVLFGTAEADLPETREPQGAEPDPEEVARAAALLAGAERPALVAGSDVWWGRAEEALRALVESLRLPTFANGLGRGLLPADHELCFARTRSMLAEADVVAVVGAPLDFRLSFGQFGKAAVVHVTDAPDQKARHVETAAAPCGDLRLVLAQMADARGLRRADHEPWIARLRDEERARRAAERSMLESDAEPIHPGRVYGELARLLGRDAVVAGDGGDFVSFAGRFVDSFTPGCFLDPGPYGCLGTGLGYAMAARLAHPDRQVVLLAGDGAFGMCAMDLDTAVRHRLPVAIVVGNNGIWGLEKHPMRALYGYDVAADLQPGCRYDEVARALGAGGETVARPRELRPALERALASELPYVVNVLLDPEVVYPRSSNLA
jgi:acetolactate synthase-1/2/3 large subunit